MFSGCHFVSAYICMYMYVHAYVNKCMPSLRHSLTIFQLMTGVVFVFRLFNTESMVYQAIWAPTTDFHEVLVSRKMLRDHSPYIMLDAVNKVILMVN